MVDSVTLEPVWGNPPIDEAPILTRQRADAFAINCGCQPLPINRA